MDNKKQLQLSFLHACGVVLYIGILMTSLMFADSVFGKSSLGYAAPFFMLLLLVISATITGSLVLGRPILLYVEGHKKDGLKFFGYTLAWLVLILLSYAIVLLVAR